MKEGVFIPSILTEHARSRLKERCGLNKSSLQKMADRAFEEGISHKETVGTLNRWITSLYMQNKTANNIRLYGDKAYLFRGKVLITVIQIPSRLRNHPKRKKDAIIMEEKI